MNAFFASSPPHSLECFYCKMGYTGRCTRGKLFGSPGLDGMYLLYHGQHLPPIGNPENRN